MKNRETFWRFTVTGLSVWRVSRLLIREKGSESRGEVPGSGAEESGSAFWAGRAVDLVCWISVWMSSQAAIWVTCGLAGALIGWLAACGAARLLPQYAGTGSMQGARTFRADEVRARNE